MKKGNKPSVHELGVQLSASPSCTACPCCSLEKLQNQEIALFDTCFEFSETLIQKLFECFTFCCRSEY